MLTERENCRMCIDEYYNKYKGTYEQRVTGALNDFMSAFKQRGNDADFYDYTPHRKKLRRKAAISGIKKIKEHLSGVCDERTEEAFFIFTNLQIMRGGYNKAVDEGNVATLGAAIWMLDQLSLQI